MEKFLPRYKLGQIKMCSKEVENLNRFIASNTDIKLVIRIINVIATTEKNPKPDVFTSKIYHTFKEESILTLYKEIVIPEIVPQHQFYIFGHISQFFLTDA